MIHTKIKLMNLSFGTIHFIKLWDQIFQSLQVVKNTMHEYLARILHPLTQLPDKLLPVPKNRAPLPYLMSCIYALYYSMPKYCMLQNSIVPFIFPISFPNHYTIPSVQFPSRYNMYPDSKISTTLMLTTIMIDVLIFLRLSFHNNLVYFIRS